MRKDLTSATRGRSKTLMYDGAGPPFERSVQTKDGIVVWFFF